MKKIITILASFGLVVTSTSNIIACHDENKNQLNNQTNDNINYDYDFLSTLGLNLCFFAYNQTNQKFKLQTEPLTYEICKISQPTEEITKAIWKEVGNQNFDFNKLINLFIDKASALFKKINIDKVNDGLTDYFPLKSLQIYDFATSVITKEVVKNSKHLKVSWNLQLILRQGDTYLPYQSQGECLIPPTALEFLTNY